LRASVEPPDWLEGALFIFLAAAPQQQQATSATTPAKTKNAPTATPAITPVDSLSSELLSSSSSLDSGTSSPLNVTCEAETCGSP